MDTRNWSETALSAAIGHLLYDMNEDELLEVAIGFLLSEGWQLVYRTRPIAQGARAGVDAILFNPHLSAFRLIDAKGESTSPVARSIAFANCLGTLVKRIRFRAGYLHLESIALFTPPQGFTIDAFRDHMRQHAVHRNCEYWLALPATMRQTILDTLDPHLAGVLRLQVLLVDAMGIAERMSW